jgi:hypothetical protein
LLEKGMNEQKRKLFILLCIMKDLQDMY